MKIKNACKNETGSEDDETNPKGSILRDGKGDCDVDFLSGLNDIERYETLDGDLIHVF